MAGTFLPLHPVRIWLGVGSGAAWLQESAAAQHHIGSVGGTFNATFGLTIYDVFAISGSGGAAFPADHASFSQDVVPLLGGGDPSSAKSHLEMQSYSIAAGLRTPFFVLRPRETGAFSAALFADVGWSYIHGTRSIEDCTDCRTDDLDMTSGRFWRTGFDLSTESSSPGLRIPLRYILSVAYQRYEAGAGLTQELRVGFTVVFL